MTKGTSFKGILCCLILVTFGFCGGGFCAELDSLEKSLNEHKHDTSLVHLLNTLSFQNFRNDPEAGRKYAERALEISNEINFTTGQSSSLINIGLYNVFVDNYAEALINYQKALDIASKEENNKLICKIYDHIGVVYQSTKDYNRALEAFMNGLKYNELVGDDEQSGLIYGNLGNLYEDQGDLELSISYYEKALEIFKADSNEMLIAAVYGNLGLVYHSMEDYVMALKYFDQAIEINKQSDNLFALSNDYGNKARTFKYMHEYRKAMDNYKTACAIDMKLNNLSGLAYDFEGICYVFHEVAMDSIWEQYESVLYKDFSSSKTVKLNQCLENGLRADSLFEAISLPNYTIKRVLSEVYSEMNQDSIALAYINQYWQIRNDRFSSDKAKEFARLEAKNEMEMNQSTIRALESEQENQKLIISLVSVVLILLIGLVLESRNRLNLRRKANAELMLLNDKLTEGKKAREKFLAIVAHDLINPIGGMESALTIYRNERKELSDTENVEYINALIEASSRAHSLLKNLLEWGKVQNGLIEFNPVPLHLKDIVANNIELLDQNFKLKQIEITTKLEPNTNCDGEFDEHMMNSIVANLLSNAIKFTQKGGKIEVICSETATYLTVTIKDNGVGMNQKQLSALFDIGQHSTTLGTNKERGTGLGLILCHEFIEAHNGKITVNSKPNEGTEFILHIPKSK